uniref:EF-hand domain-containing protein n=1 Tax=Kalanchoe fedtschenkoi TaxID=63787 RepID=A0A7N0TFZ3_KALFE
MKKHAEFFDQNHDGFLHIPETVEGFKQLGIGAVESLASAAAIHTTLSAKTRPGQPFDKDFPIIIENIKLAKHTSDSGVYDDEGRFVQEKFEAIFTNHAHVKPDALNSDELDELLKSNRKAGDFKNWLAASTEWKLLYRLGKDVNGFLPKENIRNVYDGSFFHQLAKQLNNTSA